MSDSHKFYSYEDRQGVVPISWEAFHGICKGLAQAVYPYQPDIIIGIAKGGLYPGTLIAHLLRKEFYPVRITRRFDDEVVSNDPEWRVRPPDIVRDKRVLLVDEVSSSGETLNLVRQEVERLQAAEVRSAVLYAHTSGQAIPDYIGFVSDALVLNPWDREIYDGSAFVRQPEYLHAFSQSNLEIEPAYFPEIAAIEPQVTPARPFAAPESA